MVKVKLKYLFLLATIACLVLVFAFGKSGDEIDFGDRADFFGIEDQVRALSLAEGGGVYCEQVWDYFRYYGLDFGCRSNSNYDHLFGSFKSDDFILTGHIFRPEQYKATVVVLHGYLNHCGQLNDIIEYLLGDGFAVAAFDMPGHGLSTGARGSIECFSQYGRALDDFLAIVNEHMDGPVHFIGYSTGGAIGMDYLLNRTDIDIDKIVLVGPLVRSYRYNLSMVTSRLLGPFLDGIGRSFTQNSSDLEFLEFIENKDPLQVRRVPFKWIRAMGRWNRRFAQYEQSAESLLALQGTNDTTVDWQFNIPKISEKFPNAEIVLIDNGKHALLNESPELQGKTFDLIGAYLKGF